MFNSSYYRLHLPISGQLLPVSDYVLSLSRLGFPGIVNFGIPPGDLFQIYELKESYAAIALVTFGDDPRKAGRCTWLISFTKSQNQKEKRRYKISLI